MKKILITGAAGFIGFHVCSRLLRDGYFADTTWRDDRVLEQALGAQAIKSYLPMQNGDVPATYADIADLTAEVRFSPQISINDGLPRFVKWYRAYYRV